MGRRAARVDQNQREIVAALRAVGASVEHLHSVGKGVPDLLVGYRGGNFLLEVKTASGKLTPAQREWLPAWRGSAHVVRSPEQALEAIGVEISEPEDAA